MLIQSKDRAIQVNGGFTLQRRQRSSFGDAKLKPSHEKVLRDETNNKKLNLSRISFEILCLCHFIFSFYNQKKVHTVQLRLQRSILHHLVNKKPRFAMNAVPQEFDNILMSYFTQPVHLILPNYQWSSSRRNSQTRT